MGVREDIFPTEQRVGYVQTEWASGWAYGVIGFGEAARMLTEQRAKMHANIDQIGLAVFYLQRHRVELVYYQPVEQFSPVSRIAPIRFICKNEAQKAIDRCCSSTCGEITKETVERLLAPDKLEIAAVVVALVIENAAAPGARPLRGVGVLLGLQERHQDLVGGCVRCRGGPSGVPRCRSTSAVRGPW